MTGRRRFRPAVEGMEGRLPLSGAFAHTIATTQAANPLSQYRILELAVTRGPDAGLTLSGPLVESRERLVRRFQAFTMAWPWAWTPEQVETWSGSGGWAHSTIRSYQGAGLP